MRHRNTLLALIVASWIVPPGVAQTRRSSPPTDEQIEAQVEQVLQQDHSFAGSSISSSVSKGVVTLSGNVRSEAEKTLASAELAKIGGIKTVLNNLNIVSPQLVAPPPPPPPPTPPPAVVNTSKTLTLPEGTSIPVRISDDVNSKTAKAGDTFHGTTASNLMLDSYTLVPTGTLVTGRVIAAKSAGHFTGAAQLSVELVSLRLATSGSVQDVSVVTEPISNKADGRGANTAEKAGGGAALGAVIGAVAGGGAGAGIGALSGGALGAGANGITRGKEIELKPEQLLEFRTSAPLQVTIALENGRQILLPAVSGPTLQTRPNDQN
ncbi:BON domain-containing protein [Acidipila sp. EB88]|uniref:BON domain-containing protein n=1 Tax=Acidipila sp. EB88 TaxID=2305226 RepID=UPI00131589E0|nr:BON domain-containing protein [Acidipila sp. EB88]